ncbi:imelysin family protein [Pyruvatibacter mobilis]|uniref:imelysin family protein n=1 Tax=Pyruvatibacter mobilis TaxID=1712261 RepID=UPI003D102691
MRSSIHSRRHRPAVVFATGLAALLYLASPARAADYASVNAAVAEGHILPAYDALAEAGTALAAVTDDYCAGAAPLADARQALAAFRRSWAGAEHLRFGPAELGMRSLRINFWPQARGKVADALSSALAKAEEAGGEMDVARQSFAVQGVPALDALFNGDDSAAPGTPRCDLAKAIAGNVARMTSAIRDEWTGGNTPYLAAFTTPGTGALPFEGHADATLALFKSLHDELSRILALKIETALGKTPADARPSHVEGLAPEAALDTIRANLAALEALYQGPDGTGLAALAGQSVTDTALAPLMDKAFSKTRATADSIALPLADAVTDAEERKKVAHLATQLRALRQIVGTRLAEALGLSVGFNSLDGD